MRNKIIIAVIVLIIAALIYGNIKDWGNWGKKPDEPITATDMPIATLNNTIVSTQNFDTENYVEGLEFYNGKLYASAGQKGKSFLAIYDAKGNRLQKEKISNKIFAEGITVLNGTLYQLTYTDSIVNIYDPITLKKKAELPWKYHEGWGLTNNGKDLIASNGTNIIYFLNPTDLSVVRYINVTANGAIINQVNELEYVDGFIYANQFTTDYIYKIDAATGKVVAKGDFSKLLPEYNAQATSMKQDEDAEKYFNGIAYNKATGTFWITGKNWPKMFEVKF